MPEALLWGSSLRLRIPAKLKEGLGRQSPGWQPPACLLWVRGHRVALMLWEVPSVLQPPMLYPHSPETGPEKSTQDMEVIQLGLSRITQ